MAVLGVFYPLVHRGSVFGGNDDFKIKNKKMAFFPNTFCTEKSLEHFYTDPRPSTFTPSKFLSRNRAADPNVYHGHKVYIPRCVYQGVGCTTYGAADSLTFQEDMFIYGSFIIPYY